MEGKVRIAVQHLNFNVQSNQQLVDRLIPFHSFILRPHPLSKREKLCEVREVKSYVSDDFSFNRFPHAFQS